MTAPADSPLMITLPADEVEQLRAARARYEYLRGAVLRQPISVDAWGHPTYGVVFEAPRDLTPADFDRLVDVLRVADDGTGTKVSVSRESVEGPAAAVRP